MIIDSVPRFLLPLLHAPLVFVNQDTQNGQTTFVFQVGSDTLHVSWMGKTWFLSIGGRRIRLPRSRTPTPKGFQGDLGSVFTMDLLAQMQLLIDGTNGWLTLHKTTCAWYLDFDGKLILARGRIFPVVPLPPVLMDLLQQHRHLMLPLESGRSDLMEFSTSSSVSDTPPRTAHARLDLWARIQAQAESLGHAHFVDQLRQARAPRRTT